MCGTVLNESQMCVGLYSMSHRCVWDCTQCVTDVCGTVLNESQMCVGLYSMSHRSVWDYTQ